MRMAKKMLVVKKKGGCAGTVKWIVWSFLLLEFGLGLEETPSLFSSREQDLELVFALLEVVELAVAKQKKEQEMLKPLRRVVVCGNVVVAAVVVFSTGFVPVVILSEQFVVDFATP